MPDLDAIIALVRQFVTNLDALAPGAQEQIDKTVKDDKIRATVESIFLNHVAASKDQMEHAARELHAWRNGRPFKAPPKPKTAKNRRTKKRKKQKTI